MVEKQDFLKDNIALVCGSANKKLAKMVAKKLGIRLFPLTLHQFSDGTFLPQFEENIRGKTVIIFQSLYSRKGKEGLFLQEVLLIADAARRASAKEIIHVCPYFPGRQDRKDRPRVSISAKAIMNQLVAGGIQRIMTMDLHAEQIQGFADIPIDHVLGSALFLPIVKKLNLPDLAMASPDAGGGKRMFFYAKCLKTKAVIICEKIRGKIKEIVDDMLMAGDPNGKNVVLLDDILATADTLSMSADKMLNAGAKSVIACITHPMMTKNLEGVSAYKIIEKSNISKIYVSDSIPLLKKSPKIEVVSSAGLFANIIWKHLNNQSISDEFVAREY